MKLLRIPALALLATASACAAQAPPVRLAESSFADLVAALSEEGGYFDTDNLISNESSYLHVMGALDALGVRGGLYVGVGPDQNFSYIARIRPEVAVIMDVRRDNMLQQFLFKALFEESANRLDYLCLLYGRPCPEDLAAWTGLDLERLVEYVDARPALADDGGDVRERIARRVASFGVPLDAADRATIDRFHRAFIGAGLGLRFTSHGRAPRFFYPTHRDLLLAEDLEGTRASYLVNEDDFRFLKALQEADRVIPVVGDLAGEHALPEIGRMAVEGGLTVSALYASNVEFYLWGARSFERFAETVTNLPRNERSVIIRSHFGGGFGASHPMQVAGFYSTQLLQRTVDFASTWEQGGFRSYGDLVTRDAVQLRPVGR